MLHALKSVRARLTFWYSIILLTTLVAFGLIAYEYSREHLMDSLDLSLSNEVKWIQNFIGQKSSRVRPSRKFSPRVAVPPLASQDTLVGQADREMAQSDEEIWNKIYEHALLNPKKTLIEVTTKWGAIAFRSFTAADEGLNIGNVPLNTIKIQTIRNVKGMDLRVAATVTNDLELYVAYPLSELREALDNLFSIFLILIPVAFGVSVGGGWLLAYKSLRPVDEITRAAKQITVQNLDQQIPERPVDDEIGRLISTFNGMIARLRQSVEQIRQFSADASHELRTPLTIMRGEVEIALRSSKRPDEYRRVLVSNLEEITRLAAIIDNLAALSKADLSQQQLVLDERVDLADLITELYEDSEIIAHKKEITICLRRNDRLSVRGDRVRLRQLFLNLVDNAIKYTPAHGEVTISSCRENGFAHITVSDTGIGIPKEEQARIFDRFYRVDKGRSREMGGSGLGLSISKWIAELHKGRIEVESEVNRGTSFSVYLPI